MNTMHLTSGPSHVRERGASAVEFALVFPVLFLLVYAVIVYSYIYVLQQSITYTAQRLAEAAVAVNPTPSSDYTARIQTRIQQLAAQQLQWLPQRNLVVGENGEKVVPQFQTIGGSDVIIIRLELPLKDPDLFPGFRLSDGVSMPPLPARLVAQATARI